MPITENGKIEGADKKIIIAMMDEEERNKSQVRNKIVDIFGKEGKVSNRWIGQRLEDLNHIGLIYRRDKGAYSNFKLNTDRIATKYSTDRFKRPLIYLFLILISSLGVSFYLNEIFFAFGSAWVSMFFLGKYIYQIIRESEEKEYFIKNKEIIEKVNQKEDNSAYLDLK